MSTIITLHQLRAWRSDLEHFGSKHHESAARAIAGTPTYDERIVELLKRVARDDPSVPARQAAIQALGAIERAHFVAGNDIRAYLEQLPLAPELPVAEPPPPAPEHPPVAQHPPAPAQPLAPAVPFDQWLLSERNIKLALYSGGFLLLLAGLIFVGVNWAYLPGIAKLGVTLAVTLGLYAGGVVLFKRPSLKIGGTALLAIASAFLPLNFVVTHIYLTGERGVSAETLWLVASLFCGAVFLLTTLWSRNTLFTVYVLVAVISGVTAAMALLDLEVTAAVLIYAVTALTILLLADWTRTIAQFQFMSRTLRIGAHFIAPVVFLLAVGAWVLSFSGASSVGNRWFALGAALLTSGFYTLDAWRRQSLYARWCAAFSFGIVAALLCTELHLSSIQTGLVLKLLAAVYLVVGKYLQRGNQVTAGLPLYAVSALLALFVTLQAAQAYPGTPQHLGLALFGDVILLTLAAYLFKRVEFVYGAALLLIAPAYIFAGLYLQDGTQVGLVLGALMLVYLAAGYLLGRARVPSRRAHGLVGAFLSAAALLSVIVIVVLNRNYPVMTGMLLGIALSYALVAVWLRWNWLTLAALFALNLAVLTGVLSVFSGSIEIRRVLAIALTALAIALIAVGVELKRRGWLEWRLPLYLVAGIDLFLSLGLAGVSSDALMVAVSTAIVISSLSMQWVERTTFVRLKLPYILSYVGGLAFFNALYFASRALNLQLGFVPVVISVGAAVVIGAALLLRNTEFSELYGTPLRIVGLLFAVLALGVAAILGDSFPAALSYAIAAVAFGAEGLIRRQLGYLYASGAAFVGALWWILRLFQVSELQAFAIPLGILALTIGWSEARQGRMIWFRVATIAGLVVLMGSAFLQSISTTSYAALLLIESIAAFAIGFKSRSRVYVEAAVLALIANGLAQFGPAFVNLERWIQIGSIGSILLLIGLVALFRRQRLLQVRRTLTSEWRLWRP